MAFWTNFFVKWPQKNLKFSHISLKIILFEKKTFIFIFYIWNLGWVLLHMLLPRSGALPRPDLVIRDPVLYHETRSEIFLSPFLNVLRFSGGISPNTRCAASLIFTPVSMPLDWGFIYDYFMFINFLYFYSWAMIFIG